jgi:4-amino-4-deoxy-L-arabinose transferase-like glycosyltransferase
VRKPDDADERLRSNGAMHASFSRFLSAHRNQILVILLLAFAWRLFLVIGFPHGANDEIRYTAPANNLLAGRGFSLDVQGPFLPSEHTVPLYPLFIAGVYAVTGPHNTPVRVVQAVIDTLTCLLVAFVAFSLAPERMKKLGAVLGLVIVGFLCWFTVFWTRYILTETLALFLTMLAISLSIWAARGRSTRWLLVGAICGLTVLTRADSVLLVFSFVLFLLVEIARRRTRTSVVNLVLFCLAIPVVLAPWIARNYIVFHKFQPLASEYGRPRGEYVPTGYVFWVRTWMTDETNYHAGDLVFQPGSRAFDPMQMPSEMFDSPEERAQVSRLIAQYNQTGEMTPELSDKFRELANERIKRAPLRFYLWLPLRRVASMWLTGFVTTDRLHLLARILLVLPIIIGGLIGFALIVRAQPFAQLLAFIILIRSVFFGYYGAEARYMVEAYPPLIATCAVAVAFGWFYLVDRWKGNRAPNARKCLSHETGP